MLCSRCGSRLTDGGASQVVRFEGIALRLSERSSVARCSLCHEALPTPEQRTQLHEQAERDLIGYDGSGRPVLRGC